MYWLWLWLCDFTCFCFPCFVLPRTTLRWCNPFFFWLNVLIWKHLGNELLFQLWMLGFQLDFQRCNIWILGTPQTNLPFSAWFIQIIQVSNSKWVKGRRGTSQACFLGGNWLSFMSNAYFVAPQVPMRCHSRVTGRPVFFGNEVSQRAVLDMDQGLRTQKPRIWVTGLQ